MKIKNVLVLLFLGLTLNAYANNDKAFRYDDDKSTRGHSGQGWFGSSSHDTLHEIITGSHGGRGDDWSGFGNDHRDKLNVSWIFGNHLHDGIGDWKDHGHWDDTRFCDWPTPVSPVPEPETYVMLLAGLGLMAGIARFKKKQVTAPLA